MSQPVRIAVDAMGGDVGPAVTLAGADLSLERHPGVRYLLFGQQPLLESVLASYPRLAAAAQIIHADVAIRMDEKPSQALRSGRGKSSMWQALQAVRDGQADVAVSAGNTGALMAMAKFCLRTIDGVDRPVIAALWPTMRGESVVLDVGATIGASAEELVLMSLMGTAMHRSLYGKSRPSLGLLNVGVEEVKGLEAIREAGRLLREMNGSHFDYQGFVEGDDIGKGAADVIVTEGFAGNIALKTAEGTAKQIASYLKSVMGQSWTSKLGYLLAKPAFDALRKKLDPRRVNGGVFLGLNGIVIKSHGGTDALGFAAALDIAHDMVRHELMAKIQASMPSHLQSDATSSAVCEAVEDQS